MTGTDDAVLPRRPRTLARSLLLGLILVPAAAGATTYRYDAVANRIDVQYGGVATLSAIKAALPKAPLEREDAPGQVWYLGADLALSHGATLRLHGTAAGGDVDELRLKSDNLPGRQPFVSITADHGTIEMRSTRVTSWDRAAGGPDLEYINGRAFIRVRSRWHYRMPGPRESRMDIVGSDVGYLGYGGNEAYGLVWKVVARERYVLDHARVSGNVRDSRIHDNYIGIYTSGARKVEWRNNEVFRNALYGFAPHNRSDDLLIENNNVHHNGLHGITARQHCDRVVIRNNRAWANTESGITLHDGSDFGVVEGNVVEQNGASGISVYASTQASIRRNIARENGYAGIHLRAGAIDNKVDRNEIGDNRRYGLYLERATTSQVPRRNVFSGNVIYRSGARPIKSFPGDTNTYTNNSLLPDRPSAPPAAAPAPGASPAPAAASPGEAVLPPPASAPRARGTGNWTAIFATLVVLAALALALRPLRLRTRRTRHSRAREFAPAPPVRT